MMTLVREFLSIRSISARQKASDSRLGILAGLAMAGQPQDWQPKPVRHSRREVGGRFGNREATGRPNSSPIP